MRQNWFTTALIAVLAGALGAIGFGVAGAQDATEETSNADGVTVNVSQPSSAAGGAVDGGPVGVAACPGDGAGAAGAADAGHGGGGAVAAGANTNTLANAVNVENENVNENDLQQSQAQAQSQDTAVISIIEVGIPFLVE